MTGLPDRRMHAYRPDLADGKLKGLVEAETFTSPKQSRIVSPVVDLRPQPDLSKGIDTQLILGDQVRVFERKDGWAWVQNLRDNYVGYLREDALGDRPSDFSAHDHVVMVPRTFAYCEPDMKRPVTRQLSMGSVLRIVQEETVRNCLYGQTSEDDWVILSHLGNNPFAKSIAIGTDGKSDSKGDAPFADYVSAAELLIHTPYLWGGASAFGIDCSGLVQLSMFMAGRLVLRDSDMQAETIGQELGFAAMDNGLRRGDLVFWKGHVGIMQNHDTLIHANGHTMSVALEKLEDAIERIGYLYGFPTKLRRP